MQDIRRHLWNYNLLALPKYKQLKKLKDTNLNILWFRSNGDSEAILW